MKTTKSGAQRVRDWRQSHRVSRLDVSGDLAERVRALRQARRETVEQVLSAAVATLETAELSPDHIA